MNPQNDYQFVMIPQQLASCLDANSGKMLTILLGLSSIMENEDGWFYRSNKDLQLDTRFSENVIRATLDTLYQAGIINIDCIGKGRGHRSNRIHINFESFKKYQQYSFNEIRNNPDLWLNTVKYKDHFVPSYMRKSEEICESKCEGLCESKCEGLCEKVRTNTDTTNFSNTTYTTDTTYSIEENNYSKEEKNVINIIEKTGKEETVEPEVKQENKPVEYYFECFLNYNNYFDYHMLLTEKERFYLKYQYSIDKLVENIHRETGSTLCREAVLNYLGEYAQETGRIR